MNAYLCLVTWPNGVEGLLFPRPGNVPVASTPEDGQKDFDTAKKDLGEYAADLELRLLRSKEQSFPAEHIAGIEAQLAKIKGATIRLVRLERQETVQEYTLPSS